MLTLFAHRPDNWPARAIAFSLPTLRAAVEKECARAQQESIERDGVAQITDDPSRLAALLAETVEEETRGPVLRLIVANEAEAVDVTAWLCGEDEDGACRLVEEARMLLPPEDRPPATADDTASEARGLLTNYFRCKEEARRQLAAVAGRLADGEEVARAPFSFAVLFLEGTPVLAATREQIPAALRRRVNESFANATEAQIDEEVADLLSSNALATLTATDEAAAFRAWTVTDHLALGYAFEQWRSVFPVPEGAPDPIRDEVERELAEFEAYETTRKAQDEAHRKAARAAYVAEGRATLAAIQAETEADPMSSAISALFTPIADLYNRDPARLLALAEAVKAGRRVEIVVADAEALHVVVDAEGLELPDLDDDPPGDAVGA